MKTTSRRRKKGLCDEVAHFVNWLLSRLLEILQDFYRFWQPRQSLLLKVPVVGTYGTIHTYILDTLSTIPPKEMRQNCAVYDFLNS